jgi:hypothetical protein
VIQRQPAVQVATVVAPGDSVEQVSAVPNAARVTPSKLKADNQLLSAIDGELRADAAPESLYGLKSSLQVVHGSGRMAD